MRKGDIILALGLCMFSYQPTTSCVSRLLSSFFDTPSSEKWEIILKTGNYEKLLVSLSTAAATDDASLQLVYQWLAKQLRAFENHPFLLLAYALVTFENSQEQKYEFALEHYLFVVMLYRAYTHTTELPHSGLEKNIKALSEIIPHSKIPADAAIPSKAWTRLSDLSFSPRAIKNHTTFLKELFSIETINEFNFARIIDAALEYYNPIVFYRWGSFYSSSWHKFIAPPCYSGWLVVRTAPKDVISPDDWLLIKPPVGPASAAAEAAEDWGMVEEALLAAGKVMGK